jgi:hypothetical protein
MPADSQTELIAAIVGAFVSSGATWLMWRRDVKSREGQHRDELQKKEREHRDEKLGKEREYLQQMREELDKKPDLLGIIKLLKTEKSSGPAKPENAPEGWKMRQLPGFFERLGSQLHFNLISIETIYDAFGEEILLCENSKWVWQDEEHPKGDAYWESYNELAKAIKDEEKRRNKNR